jgi:hypothetical protein
MDILFRVSSIWTVAAASVLAGHRSYSERPRGLRTYDIFCNCIFVCIFVCILFLFLFLFSDLSTESVATGISTLGLYLCFCYLYYALPVVCTSRYILLAKRSINNIEGQGPSGLSSLVSAHALKSSSSFTTKCVSILIWLFFVELTPWFAVIVNHD